MGKLRGVMAGVFLGGVLLGGVGTGIAMVEYSALSYGGEHLVGEEYLVTDNLDFAFPQNGKTLIVENKYYGPDGYKNIAIMEDASVPAGTVRYEITYNERAVTPELIFQEYEEETEEESEEDGQEPESGDTGEDGGGEQEPVYLGSLSLRSHGYEDGFEIFMENKDIFLKELKEKKISRYRQVYISDLKVKVNPETMPFVEAGDTRYWD